MSDREELRRKLREKIKGKREGSAESKGPQLAERLKADPASAMLAMGIDDASILNQAHRIVQNPQQFLGSVAAKMNINKQPKSTNNNTEVSTTKLDVVPSGNSRLETSASDDDDEEAPPPPCTSDSVQP